MGHNHPLMGHEFYSVSFDFFLSSRRARQKWLVVEYPAPEAMLVCPLK